MNCPRCGGPAYHGLAVVECAKSGCALYKAPADTDPPNVDRERRLSTYGPEVIGRHVLDRSGRTWIIVWQGWHRWLLRHQYSGDQRLWQVLIEDIDKEIVLVPE